jgi:hypothetical protein
MVLIHTDILFPDTGIPDGDCSFLMSLANEIWFLVVICRVLTEIDILEDTPGSYEEESFQQFCLSLRREKALADGRNAREKSKSSRDPQHIQSKEQKQKSIFALIDFITLSLGRILIYSAPQNSNWCYTCLSCLVKYTTKLKVLTKDPVGFAAAALKSAEDIAMLNSDPISHPNVAQLGGPARLLARLTQQNNDKNDENPLRGAYYGHNMLIRNQLETCVRFVLQGLMGQTMAGTPSTTFEICSVLYETGLQRFRTWVYQERDGDLQATACQRSIPMARPAFEYLQVTAIALEANQKLRSRPPPMSTSIPPSWEGTRRPLKTHLRWNDLSDDNIGSSELADGYGPPHEVEIRTLAGVVTIMVPLCLVSPILLTDVSALIQNVTNIGAQFNQTDFPVPPGDPGKFKAFFSLSTDCQKDVNKRIGHQNASSLSKGLMSREMLLLGQKATDTHGRPFSQIDGSQSRRRHVDLAREMDRSNSEMENWVFEETAVLVSCRIYVWTTMAFATLLAICGVIVGFTVRGRVEAVDPFNITTYCWVLAAFGILVAKSVRVETWPWRDFLHGHVRCRSVTELHSVTHIPVKFILRKLLDAEGTSILDTKGPFNAAFSRRYDTGFSIDRPLTMWTMLLSGLIMVKVDTDQGPALVCLDVNRGTKYVSVGHHDSMRSKNKERAACLHKPDPPRLDAAVEVASYQMESCGGALQQWESEVCVRSDR